MNASNLSITTATRFSADRSHVPGYDCVLEHHVYDRNGLTYFANISDHCQPEREEIPWVPCSAFRAGAAAR